LDFGLSALLMPTRACWNCADRTSRTSQVSVVT
jgi:hypothetical protein